MHEGLKKEIEAYEKRTPKSREAHKKATARIPFGVASNYRAYDPYPLFVRDGKGGQFTTSMGTNISISICALGL